MHNSLEYTNLPTPHVQNLYSSLSAHVATKAWQPPSFPVKRGVFPLIFLIAFNPVIQSVQAHPSAGYTIKLPPDSSSSEEPISPPETNSHIYICTLKRARHQWTYQVAPSNLERMQGPPQYLISDQRRSQAPAHPGTCPNNFRLCPSNFRARAFASSHKKELSWELNSNESASWILHGMRVFATLTRPENPADAISEVLNSKIFLGGAYPQTPPKRACFRSLTFACCAALYMCPTCARATILFWLRHC